MTSVAPNHPDRYRDIFGQKPAPIAVRAGATLFERLGADGIERLVKWFYAKVRYEPLLEPIFREHVPVWSEHLRVITAFWVKMCGGPAESSGGGMGRHFRLGLRAEHFEAWLRVWEENARELLPARDAEEISALARRIGDDLQRMAARAAR